MLFWKHQERGKWSTLPHLRDSVQLQTVMALCEQETIRNNEQPSCSRLKTTVTRHIDQMARTRNFKARNERIETGVVTKSQKGTKVSIERQVGERSQWKANGQCLRGDSCSTEVIVDKRYKRALLLQLRSHKLTEENPRKVLAPEEKALLEEKAESRAKKSSNESVRTRRVIVGTLPYV